MPIIVSRNREDAVRLDPSDFSAEADLQAYVHANPECLPVYELEEDLHLFVAAREFPTPSGPIDALGLDQNGMLYVIETKLFKNPDKRMVIAQALDYGAALWRGYSDPGEFVAKLDDAVRVQQGRPLIEAVSEHFGLDGDGEAALFEALRASIAEGVIRFVVLMDRLDSRLRDLVLYVNQNSRFDVYAVELEFYRYEDLEIVIPKLHGAEVKKRVGSKASTRRRWDEGSFFDDAASKLDLDKLAALRTLYEFSVENADEVGWGTGTRDGSFNVKFHDLGPRSLLTVNSSGRLWFNFKWFDPSPRIDEIFRGLAGSLRAIDGIAIPDGYRNQYPGFGPEEWAPHVVAIMAALGDELRS